MLPVWTKQYEMKTWQTDGERNTNSAGECIQGKPAPMFPEMGTFCWKLSSRSFFLCCISMCCQLLHWKGSLWYYFSHFSAAVHSPTQGTAPCRAAPSTVSVTGEIRHLPQTLPALDAALHLWHTNAMQKKINASHSGFKIINIWLKQIGLDGYKPREEFHAKCTQNFGLLLYVVTWELIQFKKVILSDAENINFIVTWTSF